MISSVIFGPEENLLIPRACIVLDGTHTEKNGNICLSRELEKAQQIDAAVNELKNELDAAAQRAKGQLRRALEAMPNGL